MNLRRIVRSTTAFTASVVVVGALTSSLMTRLSAQGPIQVNSTVMTVSPSDGLCTLPEAINSANSNAASGPAAGECRAGSVGFDSIALPSGTYTAHAAYTTFPFADQGLALPVVSSPIEIVGDSAATSIIERSSAAGTPEFRVFYVQYTGFPQYEATGSLVLRRVTVRNGKIDSAAGAIYIQNTNQTSNAVIDSVLSDNESTWGGAIYATSPVLTIRNSLVARNHARSGGNGVGAVFVSGQLIVEHSRFESNRSETSAGVASVGYLGSMDISDSVFIRNSAKSSSGALDAGGATINITRSWLHANRAEINAGAIGAERLNMSHTSVTDNVAVNGSGGGVVVIGSAGWTVVSDSTITGNVAGGDTGGGIYAVALEMTNTTVSGNRAVNSGGGISIYGTQNTYLKANNITVTNNLVSADAGLGGGVSFGSAPVTLTNSIVAGNVVGADQRAPDCWGWLTAQSAGHNLIGNSCGCSFAALATDRVGTWDAPIDPLLGALQDNGGPTRTHLPRAGSLAIDSASPLAPGSDPAAATVLDQRGVARPQDGDGDGSGISDRGATERAPDPFPARPSFSAATYSVDEPGSSVDITVRRADGTGDVEMLYSAAPGSATAGTDYLAVSGSLLFLHGETTKTFSVSVLDDVLREGTESVHLELRSPGALVDSLPVSSAILFIKDDDAFPLIRTEDAASDEGASGTRDVPVTVRLYAAYPFNVSVSYSTENGTATAGQDYDAASGSVTIGGGTTSASFVVKVRGDLLDEPDEYFKVKLLTTIGCVSEIKYAIVTIRDDDLPNLPPVLARPDDRTDYEGDVVTLGLVASDPNLDPLTFAATGLPPGLSIDAPTGVIAGTVAGSAGTYTVGVTVSDGALSAGTSFVWTIAIRNRAPQLINPGPQTSGEGETPSLVLNATDPDGDRITYGASGLPPGLTIDAATGVIAGSLGYASAGIYNVIATATDPYGASDSEPFTWAVKNTNRPPSLIAPADRTNLEGDIASLQLIGSDPDGDALLYGATGLPPGIAINTTTGVIAGTLLPGSQGSYPVKVTVSDGQSTTTQSFRWIVTIGTPSNHSPVCDAARPTTDVIWPPNHKQTHAVGVLGVTDADGDPISIAISAIWQDEPTNTVGDGNTPIDGYGVGTSQADVRAERSGTPQVPGDGRLYEIFFTARDGAGGSCAGVVRVGVPHDMGQHRTVVDSIVRYDSTTGIRIK